MSALDTLSRKVRPYAPTAPSFTVATHLRDAAAEFCRRTRCWRHVAEQAVAAPVTLPPNTVWDGLPIAFGVFPAEPALAVAAISEIEMAWFDGVQLTSIAYTDLRPEDLTAEGAGAPRFITQIDERNVILAPRAAGQLRTSVFLRPSTKNPLVSPDFVPERVADRYGDALVAGAVSRLLMIPSEAWSNPQIAAVHGARFESECDSNFAAAQRGQQRAPLRTRVRFRM